MDSSKSMTIVSPTPNSSPDLTKSLRQYPSLQSIAESNPQWCSLQRLLYQISLKYIKDSQSKLFPQESPPNTTKNDSTIIHLIRPKSVQLSDQPKSPKPKKSSKKKQNESKSNISSDNKSSASHRIRRSISSFLEQPRNIYTPDWMEGSLFLSTPNTTDNITNIDIESYDIVRAHSRIEVYEHRIQTGDDERYQHPALAREAANISKGNDNFNEAETEKVGRYVEHSVTQKTPLFWPERVYDSADNKMDASQSEKLQQTIQVEIESTGELKTQTQKKKAAPKEKSKSSTSRKNSTPDGKPRKVGRPPKHAAVTEFYFSSFITDNEDNMTDFDF